MFPFHPQTAGNKDASRHNDTKTKDMKAKKYLYQTAGKAAALAACLLLFSCSGDDLADYGSANGGKHSDNICFSISAADKAMAKGASLADSSKAAGEYTAARFVMRSPDTDDTLCVQTVISDGINATPFEDGTPATRGVPVTSLETYGSFHVQAHCTDNGTPVSQFYMDDNATNSDGTVWSTSQVRYWPGKKRTLQFFAWAPADAAFTATPGSPESTTFKYTVPDNATEQKDIVVATTGQYNGNHEQQVPLTFKHILTAVKFETGSQMQPGTIKSVALKGVKKSGTYKAFPTGSTGEGTWTLNDATADYTQELNETTTGAETDGTLVTTGDSTFMMLPQTLPDGAEVEVVFQDGTSGQERTMSASIAGTQWPQGKTVTYSLSITPEYELEFISEPEPQDAHYIIYPIHIKAGDVPGGWTITSSDPDNVTLRTDLTILTRRGFWIEEDKGTASIRSTAQGDDITIYAFLTENAGEENRTVTLEMRPTNLPDAAPQTFTIEQLCPSWNGNLGCERIEEYDEDFTGYPWGFKWDSNLVITYDAEQVDFWSRIILFFYLELFNNDAFVHEDISLMPYYHHVVIDFSKVSALDVGTNENDGRTNTWQIYNFDGINDASSMMQMLEEWGIKPDKELPTNPTIFAARTCALKNKFNKNVTQQNGQTIETLVLRNENLVWYLPARNEAPNMQDAEYPLSGDYWTSTAIITPDQNNAYKYTVGASTQSEDRNSLLRVRAVRKKP